MGASSLFCCFNKQRPNCIALTGIGASILSFAFLIWGICDLEFKRNGVEAIYIIAFVLVILCLLGFIAILIIFNMENLRANPTVNKIGKIICLVILCMCVIAFIFLLVSFIILIVDYAKYRSFLKGKEEGDSLYDYEWARDLGLGIASHEWAAIFVPAIISFIALVVMALVANVLYILFSDRMDPPPIPNITQNTAQTLPNVPQQMIFPNSGPVQPITTYAPDPVLNPESGLNINK